MKIEVSTKIGEVVYKYCIDENTDLESLHKAILMGNPPKYCNECKNTDKFRMDSNKDKESHIYVHIVCTACGAKAKLGLYKSGGYFWHKFVKYIKDTEAKDPAEAAADKIVPPITESTNDDLPF